MIVALGIAVVVPLCVEAILSVAVLLLAPVMVPVKSATLESPHMPGSFSSDRLLIVIPFAEAKVGTSTAFVHRDASAVVLGAPLAS